MIKAISFLLMMIPVVLFSQPSKKITDKKTNETYYVLRSDMNTKHGEYTKFSYMDKPLVKGFFKNGVKDSTWECYDFNSKLTLLYDYSKKELIYYQPNEKKIKPEYRIINNNNSPDTLDRPPIHLYGESFIANEIINTLRYPAKARENGISGRVYVVFTVDKNGKANNFRVESPLGYDLDEEAIRAVSSIPVFWLPGLVNNEPADVDVLFPINFTLQ